MRAIVISRPGGPEVLTLKQVGVPEPGADEVLVKVRATAINRADILQRLGHYPPPPGSPSDIPGLEFAGEVESLGPGASRFSAGQKVFGIAGGGTYADYVVANSHCLARMPSNLSFVEAASVPEVFLTAFDAMVVQGGLSCSEKVLISAVGSGVGIAGLQIARLFGAATIGTARNQEKIDACLRLGLDHGIVVENGLFAEQVREATGGSGVDLILELVGGAYVGEDINCAATRARIIVVGLMAGSRQELDLGQVLRKRLTIKGTVLRSRPLEEKIQAASLLQNNIVPLFEKGLLKPVIDTVLPLESAAEAHASMQKNQNIGKIVLEL